MATPKTIKRLRTGGFCVIFLFTVFFLFTYGILFTTEDGSILNNLKKLSPKYLFTHAKTSPSNNGLLKGEDQDRINILLLGIGGKNHEGGDLTDTIMLASYKPSEQKLGIISIPRDLYVYLPDYAWRKINHIYYFGEKDNQGNGGEEASLFIGDLLDTPIHYYININFNGFTQIIDAIEGVDVEVINTLDDYKYPIQGNENIFPISDRYEHLHIEKGTQHMDGSTALKYARSRHSLGVEGSDYARSRRQQQIMVAIKEKILSLKTLINPGRINQLLEIVKGNFKTNLDVWEIYRIIGFSRRFDKENIISRVIDASPDGPLIENVYNGAFVLETKTGDFEELKFISKNIFEENKIFERKVKYTTLQESPLPNEKATTLGEEKIGSIEIRNGTLISGFAERQAEILRSLGFDVLQVGNEVSQNHEKTTIYEIKENSKTREALQENFTKNILTEIPDTISESKADYLIILGTDLFY